MTRAFYVCILFLLFGYGHSTDPDLPDPDDYYLPAYMRGMKWSRVQEYLKDDLKLSNDVIPIHYSLDLYLNVRGHADAERSDFTGTVSVSLNVTKPVHRVELHSMGLLIEKAEFFFGSSPIKVTQITHNSDRETITVHTNRTIDANENPLLTITYQGMARMDEYGLYESWDPKFNDSSSDGSFILASRNFPTGARRWFPCFDEMDKKATFEIRVNHPDSLRAYSNSHADIIYHLSANRIYSDIWKTDPLAPYQVALSVSYHPAQSITIEGAVEVKLVRSNNSHDYYSSIPRKWGGFGELNDIGYLIEQNFKTIKDFEFGEFPQEFPNILNVIILEGTHEITVHPRLITIGRSNLWSNGKPTDHIMNLEQVRIGNEITLRSVNDMWLNQLFSRLSMNETECENIIMCDLGAIWDASLHERPLRDKLTRPTSTKQYLASRNELSTLKATHLVKLILRYCPASNNALKKYILDHTKGFADIDDFIHTMSSSCENIDAAKEFMEDYINQPGKAFLTVNRTNDSVTIKQTRYHSTYFDERLRDTRTRFSIPIFFTIDGKPGMKVFYKNATSLTISVPTDSLFLIDANYDRLYLAYYENIIAPARNLTEIERLSMAQALSKTMIAALNIGYARWSTIHEQLKTYAERRIFGSRVHFGVYLRARNGMVPPYEMEYQEDPKQMITFKWCANTNGTRPGWDEMFNNVTMYWEHPSTYNVLQATSFIHCMPEWSNGTMYRSFLEQNFLGENTVIRPVHYPLLINRRDPLYTWRDLHRFFFRDAANVTNHRVDLLAELVLKYALTKRDEYPDTTINKDYVKELRDFVLLNPLRAASMSTEIEMRLEREFVQEELVKWHDEDRQKLDREYFAYNQKADWDD